MVDQQLNNKMMNTDSYRMIRLLKTPAEFVRIYQHNIKEVKNLESVVLFPEQVLCLENQKIVCVAYATDNNQCSISVSRHFNPKLVGRSQEKYTLDGVFEREHEVKTSTETLSSFFLMVPDSNSLIPFFHSTSLSSRKFWFTNERAAIKFANRKLKL